MNYSCFEHSFLSKDGKNTVCGRIYVPNEDKVRGVIQLSHGMTDHVGRYERLAEFFTSHGFVFAGNDHLGHGKSVSDEDDFGFFASSGGTALLLHDLHAFNKYLRERFARVPIILMGHSMGSFLARLYANKYPHTVSGVIIHGTAGKNSLAGVGKALIKIIKLFKGEKYRSPLVTSMSVGAYRKCFQNENPDTAWLTRDAEAVKTRTTDKFTSFTFTLSGYYDLFTMLDNCNKKKWYKEYPKQMPTLIMSGSDDPVGNFGKGPNEVYKQLLISGCTDVQLKIYDGARHELFNEYGRETVFSDMLAFAERVIK